MLNDLARFRAELDRKGGRPVPETVAVHRWLSEVFEPAVAAIPASSGASATPPRSSTRRSSTAGFSHSKLARTSA